MRKTLYGVSLLKASDHVIAIAPGVRAVEIVLVAVGIGIARDVQPVAPPALAVLRGSQQPVDELLPRIQAICR